MKIFIKDIPVVILSKQDFIKSSDYDQIYDGDQDSLDFENLKGDVLIKSSYFTGAKQVSGANSPNRDPVRGLGAVVHIDTGNRI